MFSNEKKKKESGESQKPTLVNMLGILLNLNDITKPSNPYTKVKWKISTFPFLILIRLYDLCEWYLERPSLLNDYHLLSIYQMPDTI